MTERTRKVVVITGITRGLGRALAEELIDKGQVVLGCGRSRRQIAQLRQKHRAGHDFAAVDVSSEPQTRRWAQRLLAEYGPPDLLVNNAGVINRNAPLWKVPTEEFDRVIDVNVKGSVHTIVHFLPAMIERGLGVIVNFSSGWGRSTSPEVAPYCASKWAIEGLTQALSAELPVGLAAVALNPGIIDTDMLRSCFGEEARRYPGPEAWARRAVPFLLELGPGHNGRSLTAPRTPRE